MDNLFQQKTINANSLFENNFVQGRLLYLYHYNCVPNVAVVNGIQGEKAFEALVKQYTALVQAVHANHLFNWERKQYDFEHTVVVLKNQCVVELTDWSFRIFYHDKEAAFVQECTELIRRFKEKARKQPLEINLIVRDGNGLDLKAMEIKRTKLDLDLFYEDDFKEVHAIIQKRLNQKKDKGIVLLHGLPGTGKTTYLRYLIGKIKKRVLFVSPSVAGNLMNPEFIDLLMDNPNTVVIIEDAENIIMDRKAAGSSAVSNLLNISDGLLADFLNVQLICTFNSSLTLVDSALMRKGRLIAKYEFGKLGVEKAQRLSNHLGFQKAIHHPMTVAEISNQDERGFETKQVEVIGFRRAEIEKLDIAITN